MLLSDKKYLELEWAGTLRMRIDQFSSFAEVENNTQFSEQIFIGGFFWQIMAIGWVLFLYKFEKNLRR